MSPRRVPLHAVAALFLERQHLDRPREHRLTAPRLLRFVEDAGGLQIDSINVLDRAHYLTVWSRFGTYDRDAFDRLAYRRRLLFEYWAHAACFVPTSHLAWWRRAMLDYAVRHTGWSRFLKKKARVIETVEEAIRERGPLGNADFQHARRGATSGWWSWKPATFALHWLWMTGRTLVHSRTHFQKRFDLAERVMASMGEVQPPTSAEFLRWHLRRGLHAMGAATELDLRMYLTFPRLEVGARRKTLQSMLDSGEVVEIAVEGGGARGASGARAARNGAGRSARWLVLAEDLPALATATRRRLPSRGTTLLSPFDSFLWHRDRTARLFGFDYRIEVYTPGHKRVHGYYSLPILHDGLLIGRLDAKNHRDQRRLEVRSVHFEPWFSGDGRAPAAPRAAPDRAAALEGLGEALADLASFVGAERVMLGRVAPRALGGALRSRLKRGEALASSPG